MKSIFPHHFIIQLLFPMNSPLQIDARQISQLLEETLQVATRQLARQGTAPPGIEVPALPARPLPLEGAGAEAMFL